MAAADSVPPLLAAALAQLVQEARSRLARAPGGHLLPGHGDELEVRLLLPVDPLVPLDGASFARRVADLDRAIDTALAALIRHRAAWQPGHVLCLRCPATPCAHSRPAAPREVFIGYGPSGLPRYVDFAQWLLELRDPRLERLWSGSPPPAAGRGPGRLAPPADSVASSGARGWPVVTRLLGHGQLHSDLLEAYTRDDGPRLVGVLAAGFWSLPDRSGAPAPMALTLLALATPAARGRWRIGLDLVGIGPRGQAPSEVGSGATLPPWAEDVAFAQGELRRLERQPHNAADLERRVHGVLRELARRLEHADRARERRTRHGEERHQQGDRPTRQALADLARATPEQVLYDLRKKTLVVLGERGRTHVFNPNGRLVTSLRGTPDVAARRVEQRIWRPATTAEVARLRATATDTAGAQPAGDATAAPPRPPRPGRETTTRSSPQPAPGSTPTADLDADPP